MVTPEKSQNQKQHIKTSMKGLAVVLRTCHKKTKMKTSSQNLLKLKE